MAISSSPLHQLSRGITRASLAQGERVLVLKMIIKVADIGNVSKGERYAASWTERVVQERH